MISLNPCQHLALSAFQITAILVGVKCDFAVILVCISLMINDVEYFFMWVLAIPESSLLKYIFRYFGHFLKLGCLSQLLSCNFFIYSKSKYFIGCITWNIFFQSMACPFAFLMVYFTLSAKVLNFYEVVHLFFSSCV